MRSRLFRKASERIRTLKWSALATLLALLFLAFFQERAGVPIINRAHAQSSPVAIPLAFTVNSTLDAGDSVINGVCETAPGNGQCTLRAAIQEANENSGADLVSFDIPTTDPNCDVNGVCTINLTAVLPDLTDSVTINGPGADFLTVRRNSSDKFRIFNVIADGTIDAPGTATFSGITIREGDADTSAERVGGGIAIGFAPTLPFSKVNLINCTVISNSAPEGGGIAVNGNNALNVENSLIADNSAIEGGGICNSGSAVVQNSTIAGNRAAGINSNGGGISSDNYLVVENSALYLNQADRFGGGIFNSGAQPVAEVTNSTISNNTAAGSGGGIFDDNGATLTVRNCTISGNTATDGQGGGVVSNETTGSRTVVASTIIAQNIGGTAPDVSGNFLSGHIDSDIFVPSGFNLIDKTDGSTGFNTATDQTGTIASPRDPQFDPAGLRNNGGTTLTIALQPDSPAIDKGISNGLTTDQRGVPFVRTFDDPSVDNASGGDGTDVGAFELQPAPTPTPTPTPTPMPSPDFSFSPVAAITTEVGESGSSTVTVNSLNRFSGNVTLSIPPSAFTDSFGTNPVSLPANGSASSLLIVGAGPSITPGSYTLTLTGTSGLLTHTTPVSIIVGATSDGITQVIGTDETLGCIDSSGIGNALTSKLAAAQQLINAGKFQEAINTLTALLHQLEAQAGKHVGTCIDPATGQPFDADAALIADVKALLASLEALKPNPLMGTVTNASGSGISGATITVLNSAKTTVASTMADSTGFYFFAKTSVFAAGTKYTVKVTVAKPYKSSTPSSQTFTWNNAEITLGNFMLN